MPAAEEQVGRDRRDRDHVHVFGQEEQREAHRAVFGVVAGDQLLFGFGEVERRAVGLRDAGGQEDEEAERLQEEVPLRNERRTSSPPGWSTISRSDSDPASMMTAANDRPYDSS